VIFFPLNAVNFDTDVRLKIAAIKLHICRKEVCSVNSALNDGSVEMGLHDTPGRAAAGIPGTAVGLS
jgi:hypothetical protein